jgi:hypothetical protein
MEQTLTESYVVGRPPAGEQVGNYLLLRELGRGGYVQVYPAEHLCLKHNVIWEAGNTGNRQVDGARTDTGNSTSSKRPVRTCGTGL